MLLSGLYNLLLRTPSLLPRPASKHTPISRSPWSLLRCLSTSTSQPVSLTTHTLPAAAKLDIYSRTHAARRQHKWNVKTKRSTLQELPVQKSLLQPTSHCRSVHRASYSHHSFNSTPMGSHAPRLYGTSKTCSRFISAGTQKSANFATAAGNTEPDGGDYDPQPSEPLRAWNQARDRGRLLAFYSDQYRVILPSGHRFPMEKYTLTHAALRADPSLRGCLNLQAVSAATLS